MSGLLQYVATTVLRVTITYTRRPTRRYVEVLNLPEDPEYMQNAGFIVDLRQKQIDVQKEVWSC